MSRVFRVEERKVRPLFVPAMHMDMPSDRKETELREKIAELSRKAQRILLEAQAQREEILATAEKEAEAKAQEVFDKAKEDGFKVGYDDGFSSGLKKAQGYVEEAEKTLSEAREAFQKLLEEKEPEILALCLEMTKKIVGESLKEDSELILSIVRKAMETMTGENNFIIRVNPRWLAILEGQKDQLAARFNTKSLEIMADETMDDGAIVKTPHGSVDARLETQIQNLARSLYEARTKLRDEQ